MKLTESQIDAEEIKELNSMPDSTNQNETKPSPIKSKIFIESVGNNVLKFV